MDVFSTALNEAHQHARLAESFNAKQLFTKAMECHQNAADNFETARTLTTSIEALKSIDLQRSYHERQVLIVEEKLRRANDPANTTLVGDCDNGSTIVGVDEFGSHSDSQPYTTLDLHHDTMMGNILRERNFSAPGDLAVCGTNEDGKLNVKKMTKDDRMKIEEQATTINLLRDHIQMLEQELKQAHKETNNVKIENKALRERLSKYEPLEVGITEPNPSVVPTGGADYPPLDASKCDFEVVRVLSIEDSNTDDKH